MKIIIAGGGIGGLITALCLHKNGYDVRVYESVEKVQPLGVGINLLPHAVRILSYLGLSAKIAEKAVATEALVYANRYGQLFWEEARGKFDGYRWSQFSVHRGALHLLLYEKCLETLGEDRIFTNHHFESYEERGDKLFATFINHSLGKVHAQVEADLLIGADGFNSVTRKLLYPNEGGIVFSGNVLYRGTAMLPPFLNAASMAMIGSMKQKMVVYPIEAVREESGLQLINWVANVKQDGAASRVRDWNRKVDKDFLLALYKDWSFDWIDVHQMIQASEAIYEFPMSDRNPLPKWSFGRVTLLGDAAHPMYPIGSNGASQAILDAAALTLALNTNDTLEAALRQYDAERIPATTQVVLQNRKKGPDSIMDLMEERFPKGFQKEEIPQEELQQIMKQYKEIAGFDQKTLNAKEETL